MRAVKTKAKKPKVPTKRTGLPLPQTRSARKKKTGAKSRNRTLVDLWAKLDALQASIPPEEWKKIPRDFSYNLDHYLYGAPKR